MRTVSKTVNPGSNPGSPAENVLLELWEFEYAIASTRLQPRFGSSPITS